MRDPSRMPHVLAAVQRLWEQYPDLRLGQLMWCIAGGDPFYLEENDLLKRIEEIYTTGQWPNVGGPADGR